MLLHPRRRDYLKEIVNGDESWMLHVNHKQRCQYVPHDEIPSRQPKSELHQWGLLCWWDSKGMLYFECPAEDTTVTAESSQLQSLVDVIWRRRPHRNNVCLLHDIARPHVAKLSR
ncbi:unnamed protein product [Haemonchus placei]|uniref:DDE_3 domain-containing protein n=1 Tax=Haemonchus placei TaxID=6290 RepID=A0A3P8AZT6_HAEPC|nr:unnamed protein product [Haemonchus placei]